MSREKQEQPRFSEAFNRLPLNIQQSLMIVGDILRRMSQKEVAIRGNDGLVNTVPSTSNQQGDNDHEDWKSLLNFAA